VAPERAHQALEMIRYSNEPVVLLFGDSDEGLDRGRRAAELSGCRVADALPIRGGVERLDAQLGDAMIFVDAVEPSEAFDILLDRLDGMARHDRRTSVVAAPAAMIDAVAARAFHPGVIQLVNESELNQAAALALAAQSRPDRVAEPRGAKGIAMLAQLSEEAARIADALASLSERDQIVVPSPTRAENEDESEVTAAQVRAIIRARRMRDQFFRGEIFADPAFDMLLDLYAARLEGRRVAVSSLCIAAAVPATTALRWIKQLTDRGLFVRQADPQDGRRIYIELSEAAANAMGNYLAAVQRVAPAVIEGGRPPSPRLRRAASAKSSACQP